jgi:hypothetical protein
VTTLPRDPLTGTDRLLVDGTNLLHALSNRPGAAPPAALIGRLRGIVPGGIGIELVFDGAPEVGMRGQRVAAGLIVRHAGRRSADEVLISLVDEARDVAGAAATAGLLVVTDDEALRHALRLRGARTAGCAWLIGRLDRPKLSAPSVGNRRPPRVPGAGSGRPSGGRSGTSGGVPGSGGSGAGPTGSAGSNGGPGSEDADAERVGWKPGRGATTKRGNPHRGRPSSGRMRP